MKLVKKAVESVAREQQQSSHPAGDAHGKVVDHAAVSLRPDQAQMIGIRTAKVKRHTLVKTVRVPGYVSSATELYQIQNNFIDAYIDYVGVFRDYRRVQDRRRTWETHRDLQTRLLEAKDNLLKLGLSDAEIMKLQNVSRTEVWKQPSLALFDNNRNFWVIAQIFEQDLGFVDVGQEAEVSITAYHEKVKGIVRSVGGWIDPATRSASALIELQGYRGELSANMLVDVLMRVELNESVLAAGQAVMDLGTEKIVFVKSVKGTYEPRVIQVGWYADEFWSVKEGLKEGEEIVVDGNFMLDSESRLQSALGGHHD
jgi:multidrug efflux pump subunit AcrA (membrane-fusion protein)